MIDIINSILPVLLLILTVIIIVVGVLLILTLLDVRKVIKKVDKLIENGQQKLDLISLTLANFKGIVSGMSAGLKLFENFVGWLNKQKKHDKK